MAEDKFDLLGLTDDCIIAILGHIPPVDLSAVAFTCLRLYSLARQTFVLTKSNRDYHIEHTTLLQHVVENDTVLVTRNNGEIVSVNVSHLTREDLEVFRRSEPYTAELRVIQYLQAFEGLIEGVNLAYLFSFPDPDHLPKHANYLLFDEIVKWCSGTVKRLQLNDFKWTPELAFAARPLLTHLTKFVLNGGRNIEEILPALRYCEELSIEGAFVVDGFRNDFPKLVKFTLNDSFDYRSRRNEAEYGNQMRLFLMRHNNLRELDLETTEGFDLNAIEDMIHMEVLKISGESVKWVVENEMTPFKLVQLKKLALLSDKSDFTQAIRRMSESTAVHTLHDVDFSYMNLNGAIVNALNRFSQLQTLQLCKVIYSNFDILRHLNNLTHLKRLSLIQRPHQNRLFITLPPSLISLDHLELERFLINIDQITAIIRMPTLNHLELTRCDFDEIPLELKKELLLQVNKLVELKLNEKSDADWLTYSGSTDSLRRLSMKGYEHGNTFVVGVSRYHQLRELHLEGGFENGILDRPEPLQSLKFLTKVHFRYVSGNISDLLRSLGCVDTLEMLSIMYCAFDAETVASICRFRNLRRLRLSDMSNEYFAALAGLTKLTELSLGPSIYEIDTADLVECIHLLPTVKMVQIKCFDFAYYKQLLDVCRAQNRKLTIELRATASIEVPQHVYENCRYLEIKQNIVRHI